MMRTLSAFGRALGLLAWLVLPQLAAATAEVEVEVEKAPVLVRPESALPGVGGALAPAVPFARIAMAVGGVSALGWGLTAWTRRRRQQSPGGDAHIEVLARRGIGPRHQVVVLEVSGQRLVVGVSGDRISPIANLSEPTAFGAALEREVPEDGLESELVAGIGRFPGLDG